MQVLHIITSDLPTLNAVDERGFDGVPAKSFSKDFSFSASSPVY